jgi:transposase
MQVTAIGLDLAKNIFQIHGVDAEGNTVIRKRLSRSKVLSFFANLPRCIIGIEACATAHYWARELLAIGHEVKLMPPIYVKPYIKRGKTASVTRPANPSTHYACQCTTEPFAELGIVVAQGLRNLSKLIEIVFDETDNRLPSLARHALGVLVAQIQDIQARIKDLERALLAWHQKNQTSRRLETIPGIGFITATAIAATVTDPSQFTSGRQFAAWLGPHL